MQEAIWLTRSGRSSHLTCSYTCLASSPVRASGTAKHGQRPHQRRAWRRV